MPSMNEEAKTLKKSCKLLQLKDIYEIYVRCCKIYVTEGNMRKGGTAYSTVDI